MLGSQATKFVRIRVANDIELLERVDVEAGRSTVTFKSPCMFVQNYFDEPAIFCSHLKLCSFRIAARKTWIRGILHAVVLQ